MLNQIKEEKNIKFELKEEPNFISIIFYRKYTKKKIKNDKYRLISMYIDKVLLEEQKIINFLQKNKKIYIKDIKKLFNLKITQSKEILYKLIKKSILQKIGKTKESYYILKAIK